MLSYTTLFQTLTFIVLLLLLCTCARGIMVLHYIPQELWEHKDFYTMWFMGFKLDMRSIGIAMLIFVGLKLIAYIIESVLKMLCFLANGGGAKQDSKILGFITSFFSRFFSFFFLCYAFLLGFVFMIAAIVNFYYFRTYGSKIDIFIFGLKDDDTLAVLSIMWQDYPIVWGILAALLCGIITLFAYKIPLKYDFFKQKLSITLNKITLFAYVIIHICFIILLFIAARGSLGTYPISENNHNISPLPLFNHLCTNPLIAFDWARTNYRLDTHFAKPDVQKGEALQERLFPLLHTTADSSFLRNNPPHIVLNLMESFGTNMLVYDELDKNDLLGSLREHFESDFVFYRFLSGANGTAASLVGLFFNAPDAQISLGNAKNIKLPYNPFGIYADSGYEVVYITSGYASWRGVGDYTKIQGAHKVYDAITLMDKYPESKQDKSAYGVPDEYAYKLAFEILDNATKPTFIAILTTSNHPPYQLPHNYTPKPISLPNELLSKITTQSQARFNLATQLFQYANDAFGEFMSEIKRSHLAKNTIVGATGDHRIRDFGDNPITDKALYCSVPFYIYVPQAYRANLLYDPSRVGSHKDILPTLYELSLSNATYMSLGGRNMLAKKDNDKYAFGFNSSVWIDNNGIYPIPTEAGYLWQVSQASKDSKKYFGLHSTNEHFDPKERKDFATLYNELFNYSILWQIHKAKEEIEQNPR